MGAELCSICLQVIPLDSEAFVETCFHRFCYSCITRWSAAQLSQGTCLACPLCKRAYSSVLYDCHHNAYRRHSFVSSGAPQLGDSSGVVLSAAQRRRRSVYFRDPASVPAAREDALSGSGEQALAPALVERPAVGEWLEREVQALLLEEDVALVSSHLLGTVRALARAPARGSSAARGRQAAQQGTQPVTRQQWLEEVGNAARAYLFDSAELFAAQLWGFIASGLSVGAHDRAVFGLDEAAAVPARPASSPAGIHGGGGEDEELFFEAAPQNSSQLSISRSTDGGEPVSGGSEAYVPLMREALRSAASSRAPDLATPAAPASSVRQQDPAPGNSHAVGKRAERGTMHADLHPLPEQRGRGGEDTGVRQPSGSKRRRSEDESAGRQSKHALLGGSSRCGQEQEAQADEAAQPASRRALRSSRTESPAARPDGVEPQAQGGRQEAELAQNSTGPAQRARQIAAASKLADESSSQREKGPSQSCSSCCAETGAECRRRSEGAQQAAVQQRSSQVAEGVKEAACKRWEAGHDAGNDAGEVGTATPKQTLEHIKAAALAWQRQRDLQKQQRPGAGPAARLASAHASAAARSSACGEVPAEPQQHRESPAVDAHLAKPLPHPQAVSGVFARLGLALQTPAAGRAACAMRQSPAERRAAAAEVRRRYGL